MKTALKKLIEKNGFTIGSWITIDHPIIPDIFAQASFDFLAVDMEHSSIELRNLLNMLISIKSCGIPSLVRVGENNPNLIKRVMDIGADGVIIPNIMSGKEAKKAVNSVKYPPEGKRGVGLYRAQAYGYRFNEYKDWLREESVVIVQVEHIDAVKNIDEILATEGIDAFMIGPYDLSGSLGKPGALNDKDVEKALEDTLSAARKYKIPAGYHSVSSSPEEAMLRLKQGYSFLVYGVDTIFLGDAVIGGMKTLRDMI